MSLQFYSRNTTSLVRPIRAVWFSADFTRIAHRTGRAFARAKGVLRATKITYRRRGPGYFAYLVSGWLIPRTKYHMFFSRSRPAQFVLAQTIPALMLIGAGFAFGLLTAVGGMIAYAAYLYLSKSFRIAKKREVVQCLDTRARSKSSDIESGSEEPGNELPVTITYDSEEPFLNQAISLYTLSSQVNAPRIRSIDRSKRAVSFKLVTGVPFYRAMSNMESSDSDTVIDKIESQMNRIHSLAITGLEFSWHTLLLDANSEIWFTDFSHVHFHNSLTSMSYRLGRDRDRVAFNRLFNRSILTERSTRAAIKRQGKRLDEWYAPIDFGDGITAGHFWSTDCGSGRWDYLNGKVLKSLLTGKRILDLGCNIGIMDILMLRAGAAEVVGLELSEMAVETANLVKDIYEWKEQRKYSLKVLNRNMLDVLTEDYGKFDIVTAYCSLYYVSEEEMAKLVSKAAQIAPMMIVQTTLNEELREEKLRKSTVEFFIQLLQENGFPHVQVISPCEYSRPLLIARSAKTDRLSDRQNRAQELQIREWGEKVSC